MTREEVFKLWPRPWRIATGLADVVVAANGYEVARTASDMKHSSAEAAYALAQMLVEWSQEKP